ncbi:hypothetical protein RB595_010471 [Gaeumannomyces hyphopodioides]
MPPPNLIVGVDFGTTYTDIVKANIYYPRSVIRDWPRREGDFEQKVPSKIVYHDDKKILSKDENRVSSWSFSCAHDPDISTREPFSLFKLFVDRASLASHRSSGRAGKIPETHEHALQIATDYLHCVYQYIEGSIMTKLGGRKGGGDAATWGSLAIEFVFSVPTTWTAPEILNDQKTCIFNAGFARDHKHHRSIVDLTEAEAAAIAVLESPNVDFYQGDLFLCIDAGGGTTGLALVRATSIDPQWQEIDQAGGDDGPEDGPGAPGVAPDSAARMARSQPFENLKRYFGDVLSGWEPPYWIRVDELPSNADVPALQIANGKMMFSQDEIQSLFDVHISTIIKKIKSLLTWMEKKGYQDQVKKVILSGGLGASTYVRSQLEKAFRDDFYERADGAEFICAYDPQLVIVRGLLLNRQQDLHGGRPVLATRIARASYGILVQTPFDPNKHAPEEKVPDPIDPAKFWAKNQIRWLVKKGDEIHPHKPPTRQFTMPVDGEHSFEWSFEIVQHGGDAEALRPSMRLMKATKLCTLDSNLSGIDRSKLVIMKTDGRYHLFGRKKYRACQFEIVVVVAPADLKFEVQVRGERFNDHHQPLTVKWDAEGATERLDLE